MRFKGFIGASYTLQSLNVDCQRCVNLYPEVNEMGTGNEGEVASLVSTPGLELLCTLPTAPLRGDYTDSTGQLWAVGGNVLYQISSLWVATPFGTLNTSTGPVNFSDNGVQAVCVDGPYGYYWLIGSYTQTSTPTAAGTTTLTSASNTFQSFTGTTTQTVVLPAVSTLEIGSYFYIENLSTGVVTVNTSDGATVQSMAAQSLLVMTCIEIAPSGAGTQASGTVTMGSNPANLDTLTIAGTAITFVTGSPSGNQVKIGASQVATLANLFTFLVESADSNLITCQYAAGVTSVDTLVVAAASVGVAGNSITLAKSSSALTLSGATLSGGVNAGAAPGTSVLEWSYVSSAHVSGSTFSQIMDTNFLGATHVDFMDGYLIFNQPNTQSFYLSPINAVLPFDGSEIGSAEASPDNLMGLIELQESLYLLSQRHMEVFYDSGAITFPFARIQGAVIEIGCDAPYSIAKISNTIFWLGRDKNGRGIVYSAQGLQATRISTFCIENVIASLGDVSAARGYTYQQAGHAFYCLNLPNDTRTWVFDTMTGLWHERTYLALGAYQRNLADCHAFAYDTNVVGDYSSGNLYALSRTTYTDNSNPIVRERTAPHISKDVQRISHQMFQLDAQTGVGLDGTGQGTMPQAILQWSNDYGNTWSNEHWASLGQIGARMTRALWWRLGMARDRVYRVRVSDPVSVTFVGAEIDLEVEAS